MKLYKKLSLVAFTSVLLLTGCTNKEESKKEEVDLEVRGKAYGLAEIQKLSEDGQNGEKDISGFVVDKLLDEYYPITDADKQKQIDEESKNYIEALKKYNKDTKIDEKAVHNRIEGIYQKEKMYDNLIKLNKTEIEKEVKEGYKLVRVVYGTENGTGNAKAKKILTSLEKALIGKKKIKDVEAVLAKAQKANQGEVNMGVLITTKDASGFSPAVTTKILKSKGQEFIKYKAEDGTGTQNMVYVVDSLQGNVSDVAKYKRIKTIKRDLATNEQVITVLSKKYKDIKVSDKLKEAMQPK